MREGYLTIASGAYKYFEMAVCFVKSLRYQGDDRPVSLLTTNPDDEFLQKHRNVFDQVIDISDKKDEYCARFNFTTPHEQNGIFPRLLMFDLSPYDKTVYVDADCMALRSTQELWRGSIKQYHFTTMGYYRLLPGWAGMSAEEIESAENKLGCKLREVHAGITWFDKSAYSRAVFKLIESYLDDSTYLKFPKIVKTWGGKNNETALMCAMSALNIEVVSYTENFIAPNPVYFSVEDRVGDMGLFHLGKTHINKTAEFEYGCPIFAHYFDKTASENYQRNRKFLLGVEAELVPLSVKAPIEPQPPRLVGDG
jgi:hypothetical protein